MGDIIENIFPKGLKSSKEVDRMAKQLRKIQIYSPIDSGLFNPRNKNHIGYAGKNEEYDVYECESAKDVQDFIEDLLEFYGAKYTSSVYFDEKFRLVVEV
jgi:hypothetical protein